MPARKGTTPRPKGRQICDFAGCEKFVHAYGLCPGHSRQRDLGIELRPLRQPRPDAAPGYSWCSKCKQFKAEEDFPWDTVRKQLQRICRECGSAAQLAYVERVGREKINLKRRLLKRGITLEEYERIMDEQEACCAICLRDDRKLDIDHCHRGGQVRGLLCGPCNRGIGFLEDNVDILRSAIDYLESFNASGV